MTPPEEQFNKNMLEKNFRDWYETRPPKIQELARKYPFENYIIKEGAPYGLSCPGQLVHLYSFNEHLLNDSVSVRVIVLGSEKIPAAKEHEEILFNELDMKLRGRTLEELHADNIMVNIDPIWLEPTKENNE